MFKKFTLVVLAVCSAFSLFAQKPDWEKIEIFYTRLPLRPVAPMATKYSLEVILDSDDILKNKQADRASMIESVTTINALLIKQGKQPKPYPVDNTYYPIARSEQSIKATLKIDGCQEVPAAAEFSIKLKVAGFDIVSSILKEGSVTTNGVTTKNYYYEINYTFKVSYELTDAAGALVRDEVINGTESLYFRKSKVFNTAAEAETWWNSAAGKSERLDLDNTTYNTVMNKCKTQLNSDLGYTNSKIKLEIATAKDAVVYNDLVTAFTEASMGFNYLATDKAKAADYLLKAVAIWEKALKESNVSDKKARINANMTEALHSNLAIAYCFLEDWALCNHNIVKLKSVNIGGGVKNNLEDAEAFKKDYEARIKANKVN